MRENFEPRIVTEGRSKPLPVLTASGALLLLWTAAFVLFFFWQQDVSRKSIINQATIDARTAFTKDVLYRRWNTLHGGVYAPVSEWTQPNPYLPDDIVKDAVTSSGVPLTLVNPAYMTRQVHELAFEEYGLRGHITSLKPIRPGNAPDEWERDALIQFEKQGKEEVTEIVEMDGAEYMRLMRPFIVEEGCLKCHESQGYTVGDIRGGISVSVPMEPYRNAILPEKGAIEITLASTWAGGVLIILAGTVFIKNRVSENERYKTELQQLNAAQIDLTKKLDTRNREIEYFSGRVSQNLRKNLRHISGFSDVVFRKAGEQTEASLEYEKSVIDHSVANISEMVRNLSNFYRSTNSALNLINCNLSLLMSSLIKQYTDQDQLNNFEWDVQPDMQTLADPQLMRIVLEQLINNAVRFTSRIDAPRVRFYEKTRDGERTFVFEDNGAGFNSEDGEDPFAPFVKVGDQYEEGVGIGLAIVDKIIQRHNGTIRVESAPGEGTRFFITLNPEK